MSQAQGFRIVWSFIDVPRTGFEEGEAEAAHGVPEEAVGLGQELVLG